MRKETAKWFLKALLAGLAAFALLCAVCAFYFNVPVRVSNPDGATEYKYEPDRRYYRGIEGFGYGRTNNDGFNNLRDYTPGEEINVLLMGSSHTEGFCVPQPDSAAAVLNRLFDGDRYVYSIGMAAHTFPYCAKHLDEALAHYAPTDAVVLELAALSYDSAVLDAAADGTLKDMSSHEGTLITALQKIFTEETAEEFALDSYDYIIDAIDSLKDKAALILLASKTKAQLYSSMGAALKLDPTRIKVTEFWKVEGDPLARALRKKFKHYGQFPEKKFQVVYSDELLENRGCPAEGGEEPSPFNKPQTNGSLSHITAIFGFTLAGLVIQDIAKD